jgi:hypothetical protein
MYRHIKGSENAAPPPKKDTMSHRPLLNLARKFNEARQNRQSDFDNSHTILTRIASRFQIFIPNQNSSTRAQMGLLSKYEIRIGSC